jgi:hypothetical protein
MVPLDAKGQKHVKLRVVYSIHCFTEKFDNQVHRDHHRYTYGEETRAFNQVRYECSLQLPKIIGNLGRARVYRALQQNYTYVAHIPIEGSSKPYSLFFTLQRSNSKPEDQVTMYVQSAYIKPLTVGPNAQNWRFGSLLGQMAGVFGKTAKKERPKKKAP